MRNELTTDEDLLLTSRNPAMRQALGLALRVAPTPATVLLLGESGTGKEVMARLIHHRSRRASGPYVAVNCGAIPASLVESELFGHERGAFSGATERRVGRFEAASGGSLVLDEVSELPEALQPKLLRVLQERHVQRVGASAPLSIDVRVLATANRDLQALVERGEFRLDLYYRLNVFPIVLPPLRQRREDIRPLAEVLLARAMRRLDRTAARWTEAALDALEERAFPGNVRELANLVERALILSEDGVVGPEHLPEGPQGIALAAEAPPPPTRSVRLEEVERQTILAVLRDCEGNRTHAASRLGISLRTLRNRIRQYRHEGFLVPAPSSGTSTNREASSWH